MTDPLLTFSQVLLNSGQLLVVQDFLHQWMLKGQLTDDSTGVLIREVTLSFRKRLEAMM